MEGILYLIAGILLGAGLIYLLIKTRYKAAVISETEVNELKDQLKQSRRENQDKQESILTLTRESGEKLSKDEVDQKYISRDSYNIANANWKESQGKAAEKDAEILKLTKELTELQNQKKAIDEKLATFNEEIESLQKQAKEQFKNLATDILEEKRKLFVDANKVEMNTILDPLKNDLSTFKKTIEDTRKEDIADLTTLKNEINGLQKLNQQLSEDAKQLSRALKSESKVQGDWGEDRLNTILEAEGLQKHIDYTTQSGYLDEEQNITRRPDLIINLPEGKHLIIDSKVSLTAYVNYFNAESNEEKEQYLEQHIKSVSSHIDLLADKNYQTLAGLNTPDYVFMFMPIESALTLALNRSPDLFTKALKKKIVLTSPTMLVATMKVVRLLWQKENQVRNVNEIFKQCGSLHDKFVLFLESMENVGNGLNQANKNYKEAMDRLKDGSRKGDTIIGKFDNIRHLEAKTSKRIPERYIAEISVLGEDEPEIKETGNGDTMIDDPESKANDHTVIP
ncbi:MAG: DNA recombination protein RmuC [Bacteroidales bacterium]